MSDHVRLTGLAVTTAHGVLEHEKHEPQRFLADVDIACDLSAAEDHDELQRTISYAVVAQETERILRQPAVDLIETLAGQIAARALDHPAAEAATVTVHKPDAPAGVTFAAQPLSGPSVTVHRVRRRPFVVALGANLGDRTATLAAAVRLLDRTDSVEVGAVSPLFETDPVGGPDQPDYLNAVAIGATRLAPRTILARLHEIEEVFGRTRQIRWGARTLDLDLIQVGDPSCEQDVQLDTDTLTLPHPRAATRAFVLAPWAAVAPGAALRRGGDVVPVGDLLDAVDAQGVRAGPDWRPL